VNHSDFIKYTQLHVHTDCVQSIQFIWENKAIVSSSAETEKSVVISDPSGLKKDYVFSLSKGCSCFDFNLELHLLVTASLNSCIYLWNYYTPTAPISVLRGHIGKVISLKIQETVNYLYSLSADSVLKAWDLQKETQIQSINLDFLQIQTNLDYAQNPMLYFTTEDQSGFIIGCCDYLGIMPIGETFKLIKQVPVTHENPITSMVYCNKFQTVVTCTENSEIICWNLLTGKKLITIKNAHENEEITYSCTDKSQRRLFTAARDGTIKVNFFFKLFNIYLVLK
jgi:WD40 repeat protein